VFAAGQLRRTPIGKKEIARKSDSSKGKKRPGGLAFYSHPSIEERPIVEVSTPIRGGGKPSLIRAAYPSAPLEVLHSPSSTSLEEGSAARS